MFQRAGEPRRPPDATVQSAGGSFASTGASFAASSASALSSSVAGAAGAAGAAGGATGAATGMGDHNSTPGPLRARYPACPATKAPPPSARPPLSAPTHSPRAQRTSRMSPGLSGEPPAGNTHH